MNNWCRHILIIFFCSVFVCFCTERKPADKETAIFSKYLHTQFHQDIQKKQHYYILVSGFICKKCVEYNLADLNKVITAENANRFTFIYTNRAIEEEENFMPAELKQKVKMLKDTSGLLDKLNLPIGNTTIIETDSGKVNFIRSTVMGDTAFINWIRF